MIRITSNGVERSLIELNDIYPIGGIYITTASASPSSIFGGSWRKIEGKFLLGAGSGHTAGTTGGAASHTLTIEEMPKHSHKTGTPSATSVSGTANAYKKEGYGFNAYESATGYAGGSQAFSLMPPYLAVNIWERIA